MMTDWSYFSFALSSCSLMAGSSRSASTMSRTHRGSSSSSSTSSRVKSTGDSRDKKSTKSSFRKLVQVKIIWSQEEEENSKGTMVYWGVPNRGDDRLWHRNTNSGWGFLFLDDHRFPFFKIRSATIFSCGRNQMIFPHSCLPWDR